MAIQANVPTLGAPRRDIMEIIAELLSQQGPQARVMQPAPAPAAAPQANGLPTADDMMAALQGVDLGEQPASPSHQTKTGDPIREAPPAPALPSADDLMGRIAQMGQQSAPRPQVETPFSTEVNVDATMPQPGMEADAIVRGAQEAAASRPLETGSVRAPPMAPRRAEDGGRRQPGLSDYVDTFLAGMAGGRPVLSTMGDRNRAQNATYNALIDKGLNEDQATAVLNNPAAVGTALSSILSPKTVIINGRLVDTTNGRQIADFSDFNRQGPEIKKITLPTGEEVSVVWNPQTRTHDPVLPPGSSTPQAGVTVPGTIPMPPPGVNPQVWRKEYAERTARNQADATANLPNALRAGETMLQQIDALLKDPALNRVVGPLDARTPNLTGGANRAQSRIDQVIGGAFLQAFESLKGGGAITETEGRKATDALTRLQNARQDDADYRGALQEFRSEVQKIMGIARQRAGQGGRAPSGGAQPDAQTALSEARSALQRGAPRDAVLRRLQELGIDASGL